MVAVASRRPGCTIAALNGPPTCWLRPTPQHSTKTGFLSPLRRTSNDPTEKARLPADACAYRCDAHECRPATSGARAVRRHRLRSERTEEHTSEIQSLMRLS